MTAGLAHRLPSRSVGHGPVASRPSALRPADLLFALMVGVAVLVRAGHLVLDGAPVGVDGGNWLAFGHALLGGPVRPEGVVYPPVVPLLTTAVVAVAGPAVGMPAIGAVSAVAPAVAVYLVIRPVAPAVAPLLAGMLLLAPGAGAMASWGGYPQLLGSALIVGGTWALTGWLDTGDRRALIATTTAGTLVLATSHAAAAVGVAVWAGVAAVTVIRGRPVVRRLAVAGLVAAVAAAPLAATYGRILTAMLKARHAEPALAAISVGDIPAQVAAVHNGAWPVWAAGCLLAVTAVARDRGRTRLGVLAAGLLLGLPVLLVVTGQPRVLYEIPLLAVIGLALHATRTGPHARWRAVVGLAPRAVRTGPRARRRAAIVASAAALVIVSVAGVLDAPRQQAAYAVLDGDLLDAVDWIAEHTPADATIAVSAVRGAPFGWWVEGLSRRPVISAAPLRWLTFEAERARAREANDLFYRVGVPTRQGIRRAARLGVDYLLLTTDGPAYDPHAVDSWRHHVVFDNTAAVVIKVTNP